MSNFAERVYRSLFTRHASKQTSDLAHAVVPAVSLAVLGGLIGVNASNLADTSKTAGAIGVSIFFLSFFYFIMEALWESVANRQVFRSLVIILGGAYLPHVFSPTVAVVAGNQAVIDGVLYGWLCSFVLLSLLFGEVAPKDSEEMVEENSK